MWPFTNRAPKPPKDFAGPESFFDWGKGDIAAISEAIRKNGQPDSPGFHTFARITLNTLRGGSAVELVARAMEANANPGLDPDRPILGNHYMAGMQHWTMWVEYAKPAVEAYAKRALAAGRVG